MIVIRTECETNRSLGESQPLSRVVSHGWQDWAKEQQRQRSEPEPEPEPEPQPELEPEREPEPEPEPEPAALVGGGSRGGAEGDGGA
eukprot:COSAG01_NODE_39154_length_480_cov_1.083990_2_plen_86_part_01